jgi:hypothetical protein
MVNSTEEEKIVVDIDVNIKEAIDELLEDCLDCLLSKNKAAALESFECGGFVFIFIKR